MKEKLIRDKLVTEIDPTRIRTVSDKEYQELLLAKLQEESIEVSEAKTKQELAEELADVLTVVKAICMSNSIVEETFKFVESKSLEKGEFTNKIVLRIDE